MYTSWYTWKRHATQDESIGEKNKKIQLLFLEETGPDGTTRFGGGHP